MGRRFLTGRLSKSPEAAIGFSRGFIHSGFLKLVPTKARFLNLDDGMVPVPPLIYAVFATMILPSISPSGVGRPSAESESRSRLAMDNCATRAAGHANPLRITLLRAQHPVQPNGEPHLDEGACTNPTLVPCLDFSRG